MRSRRSGVVAIALTLAPTLTACGGRERLPLPASHIGYDRTGIASWYGDELRGRRTASGERFEPEGLTAAHRTLPLGTLVEVTALDSGRSVVVRINDRGPWRGDRLIDLSHGAAARLDLPRRPAMVRVRALADRARRP